MIDTSSLTFAALKRSAKQYGPGVRRILESSTEPLVPRIIIPIPLKDLSVLLPSGADIIRFSVLPYLLLKVQIILDIYSSFYSLLSYNLYCLFFRNILKSHKYCNQKCSHKGYCHKNAPDYKSITKECRKSAKSTET